MRSILSVVRNIGIKNRRTEWIFNDIFKYMWAEA